MNNINNYELQSNKFVKTPASNNNAEIETSKRNFTFLNS